MQPFRSLYAKLAAVLVMLFALLGLLAVTLTVYVTDLYQQEVQQKLNRALAEHIVAEKTLIRDKLVNQAALKDVFHMMMVINPAIELYLLDAQGAVLAYSAEPNRVKRTQIDVTPIRRFLSGDTRYPLLGDDPRGTDRHKVFSVAPILAVDSGQLEGYLYVVLGGELYDGVVQQLAGSYILTAGTLTLTGAVTLALVLGLVLLARLTRRLHQLTAAVHAFQPGDKVALHAVEHGDEVDQLTATFRNMAEQINDQLLRLQKTDAIRREMVVSVSHDLRTPLATLHGYLETLLLKDEQLAPGERREYLETAVSHCRRLNKLVSELFELGKLDAQDVLLRREPFNLCELVQDTVQKFRLSARDKDIQVEAAFPGQIPFVHADIGLIQRVFENLLENALRYTPARGTILITLQHQTDQVAVNVIDSGSGIPADDLPRIFDRFYQVDKSRNLNPGTAGLGLAIAKRILELHGSVIRVASRVNEGTSFAFSLGVAAMPRCAE